MTIKKDIPQMESINRISKIPVVERGMQYAKFMYGRIKNSHSLVHWSLGTVEVSIQVAIDKSLIAAPIIEMPLTIVDTFVCKSLDSIEQRVPAINYQPDQLLSITKNLVSTRIVQPVIKRADSVKQFSVQEASKYGEIAASHIDTALDVADLYVDKYLPDATDNIDSKSSSRTDESQTIKTIEHVNRLSKKLQRRLTKRTLEEARALKKQGADTLDVLLHLLGLAIKDPKQFINKMKTVWNHLSQDEPENQIPPANLEQLIAMLTRESARRFVHLINFSIATAANLPTYSRQSIHLLNIYAYHFMGYVSKTVNLERVKDVAVARVKAEIDVLNDFLRHINSLLPYLMEKHTLSNKTKPLPAAPSTSYSTPTTKETQNSSQNNQENKSKGNVTPKKEAVDLSSKKEHKKKKVSKETARNSEKENCNNEAIENGTPPEQKE